MLAFKLFAKGLKILQNQKQKVDEEKAVSKKCHSLMSIA
jgi:hypothetical protein